MNLCKGFMEDWKKEPNVTQEDYQYLHFCEIPCKQHLYGSAIDACFEDHDGYLFVANGEYGSQVNFCPMCGYEAKLKIEK